MSLGDPVDLTQLDTSTPRPFLPGAARLLRAAVKMTWFSPRGVGKSLAALLLAVQIIEEDGSVLYLDLENGPRRQAERLNAILACRDPELRQAVADRLDYRPYARLERHEDRRLWQQHFAGRQVVIVDSMARALGQLGLDENSNADVARFMVEQIDPIAEIGPGILILDNVGHDAADRTRGAGAKLDMTELAYKVTADQIGPDQHGTIRLERVRTRDGDEAVNLEAGVGAGKYGRIQPSLPGEQDRQLERDLLECIQQQPGQSIDDLAKAVHKRKDACRSRLENLKQAGTVITRPSERPDRHGRPRTYTGWYPAQQSENTTVPHNGTATDPEHPGSHDDPTVPPLKGGPGPRTDTNGHLPRSDEEFQTLIAQGQGAAR